MILNGSLKFGPAMILKGSQPVARGRSPLEDSPLFFLQGACRRHASNVPPSTTPRET